MQKDNQTESGKWKIKITTKEGIYHLCVVIKCCDIMITFIIVSRIRGNLSPALFSQEFRFDQGTVAERISKAITKCLRKILFVKICRVIEVLQHQRCTEIAMKIYRVIAVNRD